MSSNFSLQPHRAFAQLTNASGKCQKEVSAGIACTPGQLRAVLQVSTAEHLQLNPLHLARLKQQKASKRLGVNRSANENSSCRERELERREMKAPIQPHALHEEHTAIYQSSHALFQCRTF